MTNAEKVAIYKTAFTAAMEVSIVNPLYPTLWNNVVEIARDFGFTEELNNASNRIIVYRVKVLAAIKASTANIWSHPKGARGGKDELTDVCEHCGKHTKDGDGGYFHILTSGLIIPNWITETMVNELRDMGLIKDQSQGCFAIGSTCAKKLLGKQVNYYLNGTMPTDI